MKPRMGRWRASGALTAVLLTSCYDAGGGGDAATESATDTDTSGPSTSNASATEVSTSSADATTASTSGSPTSNPSTDATTASNSTTDADTTDSETVGATCGNAAPDPGEACDDGNQIDGDGCNADCVESGTVLWSHTSASGFGADEAMGVAAGDRGELYVVGTRRLADASADIWLRRYSAAGGIDWTAQRSSGAGTTDQGHGIAFADGSVYATASFATSSVQGINIWYARYGDDGALVWEQTVSGTVTDGISEIPGADRALAVAARPGGAPAIAGMLTADAQGSNVWVRKALAATGDATWTQTFNGVASLDDRADAIAIDGAGNVLVGGYETDTVPQAIAWLRKYDPDGLEVWTQTYPGPDTNADRVLGIAINDTDDIFVCGIQGDALLTNGRRWWVRGYDPDGGMTWNADETGETGEGAQARAIGVLDNGDLIVAGDETIGTVARMLVRRYDSAGAVRWTRRFPDLGTGASTATGVVADPDGGAYLAGAVDFGVDEADAWVARIAP